MMEFLDKLRKKPEHVRKRIAFLTTLGIFAVVVNIWWVSWTSPIHEDTTSIAEVVSPLGVVANMVLGMKDGVESITEGLKGQLQYTIATGTEEQMASVSASTDDIVYPEDIYGESK